MHRILAAADLTPQDLVLEIGPGRGALTRGLVAQAARVLAVEMDPQLAGALPARIGHPLNLTTVQGDARNIDLERLLGVEQPYKLVANLPYYAANPIVRRFLESEPKPTLLVVMLQQEVAQAMVAQPGKMSLLSVATQFYATPSRVCTVPPRSFHPPPAVTSAVIRLDVRDRPAVVVRDEGIFFDVVRAGFSARRKQIHNALAQGLVADREVVARILVDAGIDGMRRAQTLTLGEWARISDAWEENRAVLEVPAYAKLNLSLEVLGRRADGYHEVRTVLQTIDLADRLELQPGPGLRVECDDATLEGEANLVWQAATALAKAAHIIPSVHILVHKSIPVGMGLGGGSSDAASALTALNQFWAAWPVHGGAGSDSRGPGIGRGLLLVGRHRVGLGKGRENQKH